MASTLPSVNAPRRLPSWWLPPIDAIVYRQVPMFAHDVTVSTTGLLFCLLLVSILKDAFRWHVSLWWLLLKREKLRINSCLEALFRREDDVYVALRSDGPVGKLDRRRHYQERHPALHSRCTNMPCDWQTIQLWRAPVAARFSAQQRRSAHVFICCLSSCHHASMKPTALLQVADLQKHQQTLSRLKGDMQQGHI